MFFEVTLSLLRGFGTTLLIFALTLAFSIPLGLIICFGSMNKLGFKVGDKVIRPISLIVKGFVWIIRGTPLMLQLIIIYYGPGLIFNMDLMPRFTAVLVAFVINYSAYFSEIYRGGIEGIPKGQYEACQVLGMTKTQTFFRVILMQVVKRIIPPMGNEIITLVKTLPCESYRGLRGHLERAGLHKDERTYLASVLHRSILSGVQRNSDLALRRD